MANVHVEYTITVKVADGEELSFNKERVLTEQDESQTEQIQNIVERDFRDTEETPFLTALKNKHQKEIISATLQITNITVLKSAGDDDQM